jgi:hypothetical protein
MNKNIATLIDELTITNIKIYYLGEKLKKKKNNREAARKLKDLETYRKELANGIDKSKPIKKSLGALIDELSVTNIKIFMLVDKVQKNKHNKKDAKKLQDLNSYRVELANSLNREFKEQEVVKV